MLSTVQNSPEIDSKKKSTKTQNTQNQENLYNLVKTKRHILENSE